MHIRTAATVAAAMVLGLSLTACGGDSDSDAKPTSPGQHSDTPEPTGVTDSTDANGDAGKAALEHSVRAYTKALFGGDPKGHDLLSKRCQSEMPQDQFTAMAQQARHDYGALTIKTFEVDQISGDMARVSYGVGVPQFERTAQPWSREDGTWRWDAC
ncbi:hypothetical protein [Streptomyces buecherae]|uniref:hypothetical protein n=1 Tax=Streptomyces buecherae TaxID=2763006 RepID=UPI001C27B0ED|nr:hypothetical protein [Streptomyces buecherae]